jgi:hypothetical protein
MGIKWKRAFMLPILGKSRLEFSLPTKTSLAKPVIRYHAGQFLQAWYA